MYVDGVESGVSNFTLGEKSGFSTTVLFFKRVTVFLVETTQ